MEGVRYEEDGPNNWKNGLTPMVSFHRNVILDTILFSSFTSIITHHLTRNTIDTSFSSFSGGIVIWCDSEQVWGLGGETFEECLGVSTGGWWWWIWWPVWVDSMEKHIYNTNLGGWGRVGIMRTEVGGGWKLLSAGWYSMLFYLTFFFLLTSSRILVDTWYGVWDC